MLITMLSVALHVIVASGLLYHYFLLFAGAFESSPPIAGAETALHTFAIAVPAHDEEEVIGQTVRQLESLCYPKECFDIHVVADHCSDDTADVARSAGAIVHERTDGQRGRKTYPLAWVLQRLLDSTQHYDAIVIFDADSLVEANYLVSANQLLADGARVVQGHHEIANPRASLFGTLADADMRVNNYIRNQAKSVLGLSARLMGDGMCFRRDVLEEHPFGAGSLTEDREYGIHLVSQGVRIFYDRRAVSRGQAAPYWRAATGQRMRWYAGVLDLHRRYLVPLLTAAVAKHNWSALDLAVELVLPPFSVLSVLALAAALVQVVSTKWSWSWLTLVSLVGFALTALYPLLALVFAKAPRHTYQALIYGPAYVAWRLWLAARVKMSRGRIRWVRTPRAGEAESAE